MPNTVKRLNYYDHQFLRVPEFTDEQSYHMGMRRLHNSLLHTWGIVQGLQVNVASGGTGTAVSVSAGIALDSTGREVVLPADTNLELGGETAGTTLYITIAYDEQQTDPTTEAGGPGNTRITEMPKLSFSKNAPADKSMTLILAKVPRTATGLGTVDVSDRKQAGVVLGSDLTINTVTLKKDGVAQANWPVLSCSGANQAAVGNGSLSLDAGREIVFADNGQIRSLDQNHKLVFNRAQNLLELYEFGDIRFMTGGTLSEKMRVQAGGNIGMGRPDPDRNLTIYRSGAGTGVYENVKNDNHEILIGVDVTAMVSAMTNSDLQLRTNNATRVVIQANTGRVGIGTTAPVSDLHIRKDVSGKLGPIFTLMNGGGGAGAAAAIDLSGYDPGTSDPAFRVQAIDDGAFSARLAFSAKRPGANANPLVEHLSINSDGKLVSPMWRVTQVMNQQQGGLPKAAGFSSGGGTLMIIFSGSGFAGGASNIGMTLQLDGVSRANTRVFTNEANSHKAFTTDIVVVGGIAAGNHTINLVALAGTQTDFNDWFNVAVLELPF